MTKSKSKFKKIWSYFSSGLLIVVIVILLVPSWRVKFQSWFQSFTLTESNFSVQTNTALTDEAKNWQLFDLDGNLFALSDFSGQPIVINFWATWCPSCMAEMPELRDLRNEVDDDIKFIAVTEETPEVIEDAGMSDDYDFIFCTQTFPSFFEVKVYPTLAIVNPKMEQIYRQEGATTFDSEKNINFLNSLLEN